MDAWRRWAKASAWATRAGRRTWAGGGGGGSPVKVQPHPSRTRNRLPVKIRAPSVARSRSVLLDLLGGIGKSRLLPRKEGIMMMRSDFEEVGSCSKKQRL
jgi:hypothetical protein